MIRILRTEEPKELATIKANQLAFLRTLSRDPVSQEISGAYREVAEQLVSMQHHKCCYCERRVTKSYNDVEHYRPKGSANRHPGCKLTHGYWWLSFTWLNLLYSCPSCNRSEKNDLFPLAEKSISLTAEVEPPGSEVPLLLDPTSHENPTQHVQYVYQEDPETKISHWFAEPRNDSEFGAYTIYVCGLNRKELLTLRDYHYKTVILPQVKALKKQIEIKNHDGLSCEFDRALEMCQPYAEYSLLTYDAFFYLIPGKDFQDFLGKDWPLLSVVFP